jgi:hypothetical protein
MENCVFADEHNVADKLDYLLRNKDVLQTLIDRGSRLVRDRHTMEHRDQIHQWFRLRSELKPDEVIVQQNPFGPLVAVSRQSDLRTTHVNGGGHHLELLRQGDNCFERQDYASAEASYRRCSYYMPWMPEPKLRLALCRLQAGDSKTALELIETQLNFILRVYGASDPDPVEWAFYLIALLCAGDRARARVRGGAYPRLRHPQLDNARRAVALLEGTEYVKPTEADGASTYRTSVHRAPVPADDRWITTVCQMFRACNRVEMANALAQQWNIAPIETTTTCPAQPSRNLSAADADAQTRGRLAYRQFRSQFVRSIRKAGKTAVERLIRSGGASSARTLRRNEDELCRIAREIASSPDINGVFILGASLTSSAAEAACIGAWTNKARPPVVAVAGHAGSRFRRAVEQHPKGSFVLASWSEPSLTAYISAARSQHRLSHFDFVFLARCPAAPAWAFQAITDPNALGASMVLIEDLLDSGSAAVYRRLIDSGEFALDAQNPDLRNGYAVFRRMSPNAERNRDFGTEANASREAVA